MQDSRLTPHSHQPMCISVTGEARVKLLLFHRTCSRTSYYEFYTLSYTGRQLSLLQISAFFPIKAFFILSILYANFPILSTALIYYLQLSGVCPCTESRYSFVISKSFDPAVDSLNHKITINYNYSFCIITGRCGHRPLQIDFKFYL